MAYTPPSRTEVNFDLIGEYSPPANDAADLSIPFDSGGVSAVFESDTDFTLNIYLQLSTPAFESNTAIESEVHRLITVANFESISDLNSDVLWFADTKGFDSVDDVEVEVLWYTVLTELESNNELEQPGILLQISLLDINGTTSLDATTARRVALINMDSVITFGPEYISEIAPEYDVISCWAFENYSRLDKPILSHILDPEFEQDTAIPTPVIIANDEAHIVAANFENNAILYSDIGYAIHLPVFSNENQLDILAIKSMPAGDQYLICFPFVSYTVFDVPVIQMGINTPEFDQTTEFGITGLYAGYLVSAEEFAQDTDLNSGVYPVIVFTDFENETILFSDIEPALSVPDFEQISILSADIQTGVFVEFEAFENRTTIEVEIPITVPVSEFEQDSELELFTISEFIAVPEFNVSSQFAASDIRLFTIDNSQIYYFLVITGDDDSISDIEIPFTSVQARRRNTEPTYVTVAIPSLEYAAAINERANNKMQVYMGYRIDKNTAIKQLILETNIDQINIYNGPIKQSIVLIGGDTSSYVNRTIELKKPIYSALVNGKTTHRFAIPKIDLRPGDTAVIGTDTVVVDTISLYIKNTNSGPISTMEIASA